MESRDGNTDASFESLDDDTLFQVLLRCNGDDHSALGLTCKRVRGMLLTSKFQKERAVTEWAETKAIIRNPKEDLSEGSDDDDERFSNDLGHCFDHPEVIRNDVDLIVDGRKAGSMEFCLVNRRNTRCFHEACDAASQDLQETGCCFFDNKGRPRIASVRDAIKDDKRGFLYISRISWNQEYRRCSFVGAHALRSFLADPKLENRWAVAIYVPEYGTQLTEDDHRKQSDIRCLYQDGTCRQKTVEEREKMDTWEGRCEELINMDMQQFFRAGFQQVKETVSTSIYKFVFVVPSYLESPILSNEETEAVKVLEASVSKKAPSGADAAFLQFMIKSSSRRNSLYNTIKQHEGPSAEAHLKGLVDTVFESQLRETIEESTREFEQLLESNRLLVRQLEERLAVADEEEELPAITDGNRKRKLTEDIDKLPISKEKIETQPGCARDELRKVEEQLQGIEQVVKGRQAEMLDKTRLAIQEQFTKAVVDAREKLDNLNAEVREGISRFLSSGATIQGSHVLHACAQNRVPEFIDMLVEAVPASETLNVLNGLDRHGMTPLMCAARAHKSFDASLVETIKKLLHLGADKDIVDEAGETALGKFRDQKRSMIDYRNTFGRFSEDEEAAAFEPQLEALLMPFRGATKADDAYLDAPSSDESDEEIDFSDESDEESDLGQDEGQSSDDAEE